MSAKFTCQFTMNDPEGDYAQEAVSILAGVVYKLGEYRNGGDIRDVNGSKIGTWKLR